MGCEGKIYVEQIGVLLKVDTQGTAPDCPVVDWEDASYLGLVIRQPDKTEVAVPATLVGSVLQYTTTTKNDLPLPGNYQIQAHVIGPTYDALGETARFRVYDRWK